MPIYCYSTESGKRRDVFLHHMNPPKAIDIDGEVAHRDYRAERAGPDAYPTGWPRLSDAMGVHPDQIQETRKFLSDAGVQDTKFHPDGRCQLENPRHERAVMKARGFYHRNDYRT